jgi:hypothetical protein
MIQNTEIAERLEKLFTNVSQDRVDQLEIDSELNTLLQGTDDDYTTEKLRNALEWSGIYFSPRRWQKWGDISVMKSFLLGDINKAKLAAISRK